jgi:hypothetical protein
VRNVISPGYENFACDSVVFVRMNGLNDLSDGLILVRENIVLIL